MIIAVDFDGVLMDPGNILEGYRMGKPVEGAKEALQSFVSRGDTVIVFTYRAIKDTKYLESWLTYFGIPYDEITAIKPNADFFIDNNGIRFENWEDTLKEISSKDCRKEGE